LLLQLMKTGKKMLKREQHKYVKNIQHLADIFYKIKTKKSRVDSDNTSYIEYLRMVNTVYNEFEKQKLQKPQRLQSEKKR
jgi:hypothetical protein